MPSATRPPVMPGSVSCTLPISASSRLTVTVPPTTRSVILLPAPPGAIGCSSGNVLYTSTSASLCVPTSTAVSQARTWYPALARKRNQIPAQLPGVVSRTLTSTSTSAGSTSSGPWQRNEPPGGPAPPRSPP